MIEKISSEKIDLFWRVFAFSCIALVLMTLPELSLAQQAGGYQSVTGVDPSQGGDPISQGLCNIITLITGKVGKAISTIAVIFLGVGLFLGKISWGLAIAVGIGIAGRQVWLQHLPADKVPACGPGLEYMMEVFPFMEAMQMIISGSGECAEVHWTFLSLSIAEWSLICFSLIFIATILVTFIFKPKS